MNEDKPGFLKHIAGFFRRFFIIMGVAATVAFVLLFMAFGKVVHAVPPALPDSMILTYTFKPGLVETVTKPSIDQPLFRPATTFHEVLDGLTQAAKDSRVKGFVARIQDVAMAPAQLQELRDTLAKFRQSGKFAYVFAEDFGPGMGAYYLASSFGQIWLQPVGSVSINGVSAEVPFLRELMDKVGVSADFSHKGIYKSAPESFTETGMSAPHREMMTGLVSDLADQMVAGIAADRKMTVDQVRQIVNGAPYGDSEALQLKLVDRLGYYDEMLDEALLKAGGKGTQAVKLSGYSFKADTLNLRQGMAGFIGKAAPKAKIALIFGEGDIVSYKNGGGGMSADKIVAAFDDAQKDGDVAAVVFRIDSPGGSPAAAEAIRHAVVRMQKKSRPVIVSMGGYAASGGYWVAAPADKIVAEPATITGSIGVFGGKIVFAELWKKLGVNWDSVQSGDHARMWSFNTAFSVAEKARFESLLDNTYEAFITRVMEGRKLTHAQVEAVAEGHVWTGRQAKEKGLVDELGGLDKAIELAKAAAKLKPDQEVTVERFPGQKSMLELFLHLATEGALFIPGINISADDILRSLKAETDTDALKAPEAVLR